MKLRNALLINFFYIQPISSLGSTRFPSTSIKARVTTKSDIAPWVKGNREGRVFLLGLLDESEEITGVVFDDEWDFSGYDKIQVGNVYLFASFEVTPANEEYKILLKRHQIIFLAQTVFELCENVPAIPRIRFNFVSLREICNKPELTPVDTIGVCVELGPVENRGGFPIREVVLLDSNEGRVTLNLWKQAAFNFDGRYYENVILVKGTRLKQHNGEMKLNFGWYSYMEFNPDIPEGRTLLTWFQDKKKINQISQLCSFGEKNDV